MLLLPHPPAAVLFDMDGVLIDSYAAWRAVVDDTRVHFGLPTLTDAEFAAGWGQGMDADVAVWFVGHTSAEVGAYYHERFPHHVEAIAAMAGAREVLETLAARGVPRACVTNTPGTLARKILEVTELAPLLAFTLGGDEVAASKPAPDLLHAGVARLGCAVETVWFVGDTHNDARAAAAAGMPFVGFAHDAGVRVADHQGFLSLLGGC